jgi:hypothetical protein
MVSSVALFAIYLASESVRLDAELRPTFSAHQIASCAASTRAGLARWAATAEGRAILARLRNDEYEVTIVEDATEPAIGRAPHPNAATLIAGETQLKRYTLILNPALAAQYDNPQALDLGLPRTPADVMAAAWAAEMLHIEFYSRGIPLPHHIRDDFQERWRTVALQLGFPRMEHGTEHDEHDRARDPVVTIGGPERKKRTTW